MAVVISGLFCIIVGLALGVGGAKVISLGGTWYFAILAAGFLLTGVLLLMRRRTASVGVRPAHAQCARLGVVRSRPGLVATGATRQHHRAARPVAAHHGSRVAWAGSISASVPGVVQRFR